MPSVPSFYPSTDNLPHGLDRADGLYGRLGTPTPSGAVKYDSPNGRNSEQTIEELPSSPTMERAEQCTVRKSFTGPYPEMLTRWIVYPRGTLVVDSGGNFFRVLSATLNHVAGKGETGQLDLVCEAMSFDSPPDEFSCNTVNLGLDIMKNPRYFYALIPTNQLPTPLPSYLSTDTPVQSAVKSTIIRAVQAYRENPLVPPSQIFANTTGYYHDLILGSVIGGKHVYTIANPNYHPEWKSFPQDGKVYDPPPASGPPAPTADGDKNNVPVYYVHYNVNTDGDPNGNIQLAMAAAQELMSKLWRMEDTPPVYGLEICWSEYYWRPPFLNLGSYIEDPLGYQGGGSEIPNASPALPDYFFCPNVLPDGSTVFDLIGNLNPQYYSRTGQRGGGTSISWLRVADTLEFCRTFFKVTRKWLGAPIGCWDKDLFNQKGRPTLTSNQYKKVIMS